MQALEERVRAQDGRIAALETQLRERSAQPGVPQERLAWRKLRTGMSEGDVEGILGSPSKVDAYGAFTVWQYGRGQVQFDGASGKVTGWHEP